MTSRVGLETGALMTYDVRPRDYQRRIAEYVDRILQGAKPAEMPIELPTRYDLIVSRRTVRELGLTLPPAFADQVDEWVD